MSGVCIEKEKAYIEKGKSLLSNQNVKFINESLPPDDVYKSSKILLTPIQKKNSICIGLHTCAL